MSKIVGTSGRKEGRSVCRHGYYKGKPCKNADEYGYCCMSSCGQELPPQAYCDTCTHTTHATHATHATHGRTGRGGVIKK